MTDSVTESVRMLAGRYQVGEQLGRGGMADVHLGLDARLGRKVAIKLLKPSLANDPSFRTRFRQEAQSAARMAHPTIVRVYDAGEETVRDASGLELQVPFIVMEYVEGRLLGDLIAQGPVAPAEAIRIVDGVLTALEYSHRAGVVHRDIKPSNIMVTSNGQVKVMDFGIARAISDSQATIAQTSAILGTAQYFSPEQARGEAVDARTDLYSTGVVLYELLTGRPPFRSDTAVAVAYQHVSEAPVPPNSVNSAVSPALSAVVMRALAKDRFERFQTAADFRSDLDVVEAGKVPVVRPGGDRSDDFNATLFGVGPGSAAGSEATLRRLASDDDERAPRSTQSRPPIAWIWAGIAVLAVVVVSAMVWVFSLQQDQLVDADALTVPDLVGQVYGQDLKDDLESDGFVVQAISVADPEVPQDHIVRMTPGEGVVVQRGQTLQLWVSTGPADLTVPDLRGKPLAEAQQALIDVGLKPDEATQTANSGTVPKDVVISTSPDANATQVRPGTVVTLTVSTGTVAIPDTRGRPIADAQTDLQAPELGLTVAVVLDSSCTGGTVTGQSAIGEQPQGTKVTLTYCMP